MNFTHDFVGTNLSSFQDCWIQVTKLDSIPTIQPVKKPTRWFWRVISWLGFSNTSLAKISRAFNQIKEENFTEIDSKEKAEHLLNNFKWINEKIKTHNRNLHFLFKPFLSVREIDERLISSLEKNTPTNRSKLKSKDIPPIPEEDLHLTPLPEEGTLELGLPNLSYNQCWLNAALIFFATTPIFDHIFSLSEEQFIRVCDLNNIPPYERASLRKLTHAIRKEINYLRSTQENKQRDQLKKLHGITCQVIDAYLKNNYPRLSISSQQDSCEFLSLLIAKLDPYSLLNPEQRQDKYLELVTNFEPPAGEDYGLFSRPSPSLYIQKPIVSLMDDPSYKGPINLSLALLPQDTQIQARPSLIEGNIVPEGERLQHDQRPFIQKTVVTTVPNNVMIMIERYDVQGKKYSNPLILDNGSFTLIESAPLYQEFEQKEGDLTFLERKIVGAVPTYRCIIEPYAAITHKGDKTHIGHYVAYAKATNGQWKLYNDSVVSNVDSPDQAIAQATVIMGRVIRREPIPNEDLPTQTEVIN